MNNSAEKIQVEPPKYTGNVAEFYMQTNKNASVACVAHIHNAIEMLYIKEGSYTVILDGYEYNVEEGDLILFCSNSIHYVITKENPINRYYVIKIPPEVLFEFSKPEKGAEYIMRFALNREGQKSLWRREELENSDILSILKSLVEEYEKQSYASEIAIKLKTVELLLAILRKEEHSAESYSNQTVELIYRVILYIRDNYAEDIDEKKLAQSFGMSYSYFARSFKRIASMSFRKYLNITRIHAAEQLLCSSNESITETAAKCGYNSTSYFINVYRTIKGETPHQKRAQMLKGIK